MHLQATHMWKEARQLFWPWVVITGAGALFLLTGSSWRPSLFGGLPHFFQRLLEGEWLMWIGYAGIPLLATLPMGYEFQYRTLSNLLAGPVDRKQIWQEKLTITLAAVLLPSIIFILNMRQSRFHLSDGMITSTLLLVLSASAMYWTLRGRGTMGGLALNITATGFAILAWQWLATGFEADAPVPRALVALTVTLVLVYSGGMVWMGRRALIRYQVIEGSPGGELDAIASRLAPRFFARWFVCRPRGVVLNLIRRELRLLRPLWPLAILTALAWIVLVGTGAVEAFGKADRTSAGKAAEVAVVLTTILSPLLAVLAGVLSLGEDKQHGTHEWHMTLPVSPRLQWAVKLSVALVAGVVCSVLIPVLIINSRSVVGSAARPMPSDAIWSWLLAAAIMTTLSFWLACAVKGTVRAVLWIVPLCAAFGLVIEFAQWSSASFARVAEGLLDKMLFRTDAFWVSRIIFDSKIDYLQLLVLGALLPTLGFVILHSFRLFRGQGEDTNRQLVRNFLPLAMMLFLFSFTAWSLLGAVHRSYRQVKTLFTETHEAIAKVQEQRWTAGVRPLPMHLTAVELANVAQLSPTTRHWLGDSTIVVVPRDMKRFDFCCGYSFGVPIRPHARQASSYSAVFPLANGSACTMTFFDGRRGFGMLGGAC